MSDFKKYKRKSISEMRPYVDGEVLDKKVSISKADLDAGSPKEGDMIARNPENHEDQWLVAKDYFEDNLEPVEEEDFDEFKFIDDYLDSLKDIIKRKVKLKLEN